MCTMQCPLHLLVYVYKETETKKVVICLGRWAEDRDGIKTGFTTLWKKTHSRVKVMLEEVTAPNQALLT
jgi:hypothetical protein